MVTIGKLIDLTDRAAWRQWLAENHAIQPEAWLLISKKSAPGLHLEDAIEEALCFGWVDSVMKSLDEKSFALRFTPRKDKSVWSESNKRKVQRLIEQGQMTEAGLAKVRAAQASGEWQRATSREVFEELPPDLESALAADPKARVDFESLPPSQRKQYIWWVASAKGAATRQKRIAETLRLAREKTRPA